MYEGALADLSDDDVMLAAKLAVAGEKWFPTPVVLRDKVQPQSRIDVAVTEEASAAYQRVLSCNTYTSEAGAVWSFRQVRDEVGEDAAQAFLAAGGPSAFRWADEIAASLRFKRFMEAYRERVEERHQQRAALHAGRGVELGLESAPDKLHKYITGGSE